MPSGYTRILRAFLIATFFISASGTLWAPATHAHETWQSIKSDADMLSTKGNFRAAAGGYERALALCPQARENDRVDMQLALATAYNHLMEIDKAVSVLKDANIVLKQLKKKNTLDPQVLVNLQTLIETCDKGYDPATSYEKRTRYKARMTEAVNNICADVYPRGLTTKRKLAYARSFIANGDLPGCLKSLEELYGSIKKSNSSDPLLSQCEWGLAAVQQRLGKPQLMATLANREMKLHSQARVLGEVANANLWAANYDEGKRNLDKALLLLKRKPNRDDSELILNVYIDICQDVADYKAEEIWQRKRLALFAPGEPKYQVYQRGLAHNLRRQKRFADADKVRPKTGHHRNGALTEWDWFLTDKEKEDVARADAQGRGRKISIPREQGKSAGERP